MVQLWAFTNNCSLCDWTDGSKALRRCAALSLVGGAKHKSCSRTLPPGSECTDRRHGVTGYAAFGWCGLGNCKDGVAVSIAAVMLKTNTSYPTFTLRCSLPLYLCQERTNTQVRPRVMRGKGYAGAATAVPQQRRVGTWAEQCLPALSEGGTGRRERRCCAERWGVGSNYSVKMEICVPFPCSALQPNLAKCTTKSTIGNVKKQNTHKLKTAFNNTNAIHRTYVQSNLHVRNV